MADKLPSVDVAAKHSGIARNTLYRMIRNSKVPIVIMPNGILKVRRSTADKLKWQQESPDFSLPEGTLDEIRVMMELKPEDFAFFKDK